MAKHHYRLASICRTPHARPLLLLVSTLSLQYLPSPFPTFLLHRTRQSNTVTREAILAEPRRTSCERIYAYANRSYRSHGLSTASYPFAHIYSMVLKVPLLHAFHPISNRRLLTPSAQRDSRPISLSLQDHVPQPSHDVPDRDPCFLGPRNTRDII